MLNIQGLILVLGKQVVGGGLLLIIILESIILDIALLIIVYLKRSLNNIFGALIKLYFREWLPI